MSSRSAQMLTALRKSRSMLDRQLAKLEAGSLQDPVRLQRVHLEVMQLGNFAEALLARTRSQNATQELVDGARDLLTYFRDAGRQIAAQLERLGAS